VLVNGNELVQRVQNTATGRFASWRSFYYYFFLANECRITMKKGFNSC
jgi:hypothetical protein